MPKECDIVLLTWNHRETTQKCLESIFRYTATQVRLLIVDNGSDQPGAKEYLESVRPRGNIAEVVLIRNQEDLGFSRGMNVGIRFCLSQQPAPYLCLVSNDVVMTPGWLSEMMRIAGSKSEIGLVNPISTNFGFYPPSEEENNEYGDRITRASKGKWRELGWCIGFCFLVKREVFEKIGLLDEIFGMAYYEDADFSKRAQTNGYLCALALGSYVYHAQGGSFGKHPQKSALFLRNEEIFYSRWQLEKPERICFVLNQNSNISSKALFRKIRDSANRLHRVWVLHINRREPAEFPNHWSVQKIGFSGPSFLFYPWALTYVLLKKKKFNKIIVDHSKLLSLFKGYQRRHHVQLELL